jgi:porin
MTPGLRDQYAVELFYRLQLSSSFELTPDIQFMIDPSLNPAHDFIAVFGARARLSF